MFVVRGADAAKCAIKTLAFGMRRQRARGKKVLSAQNQIATANCARDRARSRARARAAEKLRIVGLEASQGRRALFIGSRCDDAQKPAMFINFRFLAVVRITRLFTAIARVQGHDLRFAAAHKRRRVWRRVFISDKSSYFCCPTPRCLRTRRQPKVVDATMARVSELEIASRPRRAARGANVARASSRARKTPRRRATTCARCRSQSFAVAAAAKRCSLFLRTPEPTIRALCRLESIETVAAIARFVLTNVTLLFARRCLAADDKRRVLATCIWRRSSTSGLERADGDEMRRLKLFFCLKSFFTASCGRAGARAPAANCRAAAFIICQGQSENNLCKQARCGGHRCANTAATFARTKIN